MRHPVADRAWDPIVTPWHLDERIPAFPIPATATEVVPLPSPTAPSPPG